MEIADLAPSEWERQEAGRVAERLQRSHYAPSRLPPQPGLPLTLLAYAFRTRDGTMGMMQLVGFGEGRPGIVVRYKTVKRAHFE